MPCHKGIGVGAPAIQRPDACCWFTAADTESVRLHFVSGRDTHFLGHLDSNEAGSHMCERDRERSFERR